MNAAERYRERVRDDCPPLVEAYDELLDRKCAPRFAAAALFYTAGTYGPQEYRTLDTVATVFDTSKVTIRKWEAEIIDLAIGLLKQAGCYEPTSSRSPTHR
ncbi:hypothetical protein [Halegenticoccus soli]|uniref:hypothetical protein n=1 Tax=Halegenticoccus soli TaxID=1985678 RepID=UPI001E5CB2D5|nr:hypothetical protein [Halegenticoccus soli]